MISERQVPTVPHESQNLNRAAFVPYNTHPVSRFLMDSSRVKGTAVEYLVKIPTIGKAIAEDIIKQAQSGSVTKHR